MEGERAVALSPSKLLTSTTALLQVRKLYTKGFLDV